MRLLVFLFCLVSTVAVAHDANRPELDQWFMGLHSGHGPCCDGHDALHLRDVDWETQNKEHSHFRVKIPKTSEGFAAAAEGKEVETIWVDVDDYAVIDEPNRDGATLVWPYYTISGVFVRCFMPGAET